VHEHRAGLALHVRAGSLARFDVGRAEANPGAEATDIFLLWLRRVFRHDDPRRNPAARGGIGERRTVISRRVRDDAAFRFIRGEREHRIDRAARLERPDLLQVLALERERCARFRVEARARQHRRAVDEAGDPVARRPNRSQIRECCDGARVRCDGARRCHQLPGRLCALGKKRSFHDSGFVLIAPAFSMKLTYFITFCGVVV
jgi:hypothetical protein